jgi:preprotein translocase subunit SecD
LHTPETFRVARSSLTSDESGYPAVGFELAAEEHARFERWTAERTGRSIGVLVDGEVHMVVTLASALPGRGYIGGGPMPFTREEALALVARLDPGGS